MNGTGVDAVELVREMAGVARTGSPIASLAVCFARSVERAALAPRASLPELRVDQEMR